MTNRKNQRSLQVYCKCYPATRQVPERLYPYLRLQGKWLQDCGFRHGDRVTVIQTDNCLIILNKGRTTADGA